MSEQSANRRFMKNRLRLDMKVAWVLVLFLAGATAAQEITLIDESGSLGRILVGQDASDQLWEAADELREHLYKITGVFIMARPTGKSYPVEIILGAQAAATAGVDVTRENLGEQGYIIRTLGNRLIIAGASDLGTLYGVYGFLEDHLGVRWFTPDFTKIPRRSAVKIGQIDERFVPVFESRMLSWANSRRSIRWSSRMRVNCFIHNYGIHIQEFLTAPILRGQYNFVGNHAHTMGYLLPPSYFDKHPEYFSQIDGKRIKEHGQPCLTNPKVASIMAANVMVMAASSSLPNGVISVSQNDWGNYCQCSRCRAAYEEKGLSQTHIEFVNNIARKVYKKYPDVLIETLAYKWSRTPPKDLKLHPNMLIRYAAIAMNRKRGYHSPASDAAHCKQWLEEWIAASPRVWVWYYSGRQSLAPWENLNSFGRDFRYFAEVGVKGMFLEGSSWHPGIDLGVLKAYLLAKLSWNPNLDAQAIIDEFIDNVYGPAAAEMRTFIELISDLASYRHAGLLKPQAVREMFDACERAEQLAAGDEELRARISLIRLSCDYVTIVYLPKDDPRWSKAYEKFFANATSTGLLTFYSWETRRAPWKAQWYSPLEEFRQALDSGAVATHVAKLLPKAKAAK